MSYFLNNRGTAHAQHSTAAYGSGSYHNNSGLHEPALHGMDSYNSGIYNTGAGMYFPDAEYGPYDNPQGGPYEDTYEGPMVRPQVQPYVRPYGRPHVHPYTGRCHLPSQHVQTLPVHYQPVQTLPVHYQPVTVPVTAPVTAPVTVPVTVPVTSCTTMYPGRRRHYYHHRVPYQNPNGGKILNDANGNEVYDDSLLSGDTSDRYLNETSYSPRATYYRGRIPRRNPHGECQLLDADDCYECVTGGGGSLGTAAYLCNN
jgi:hypothetical protein